MEITSRDVGCLATVALIGGTFFGLGSATGIYGSRGERNIYSFSYKGEQAAVVRVDKRWSPDLEYIKLGDGSKIKVGSIITDDGKEIKVNEKNPFYGFKVRNAEE